MKRFVTLFNSAYLSRGLVLYESMLKYIDDFFLYILAFDDDVYARLISFNLKNVEVISLSEFEDEELLRVKQIRTAQEYCWTCASKSLLYVIEKYSLEECTYIDADIMFFSNPSILFNELKKDESVIITPHRYSDYCDQTRTSGKYCVQFVYVKNDENGMKTLRWWVDQCMNWCYSRFEDGKFGDQKYLDSFNDLFEGVHDLEYLGGGVAPWNVSQYKIINNDGILQGIKEVDNETFNIIFYHFHGMTLFDKDVVHLASNGYLIRGDVREYIYGRYLKKHFEVVKKYKLQDLECNKQHYRDDNLDELSYDKNYYRYSMMIE